MNYTINENKILLTQLGDEGILFDLETNEYISLNETLYKILQGVQQGNNTETIVLNLCQEYSISEAECKTDVDAALAELEEKKYIIK